MLGRVPRPLYSRPATKPVIVGLDLTGKLLLWDMGRLPPHPDAVVFAGVAPVRDFADPGRLDGPQGWRLMAARHPMSDTDHPRVPVTRSPELCPRPVFTTGSSTWADQDWPSTQQRVRCEMTQTALSEAD